MISKIILTTILVYLVGHALAIAARDNCKGWSCDVVTCPDGYAVLVPGKGYLPCEKFYDYVDKGNHGVLLK